MLYAEKFPRESHECSAPLPPERPPTVPVGRSSASCRPPQRPWYFQPTRSVGLSPVAPGGLDDSPVRIQCHGEPARPVAALGKDASAATRDKSQYATVPGVGLEPTRCTCTNGF